MNILNDKTLNIVQKVARILCSAVGTALLLFLSPLLCNTYIGASSGHFIEPDSVPGTVLSVCALLLPALGATGAFLAGILFGKYRLPDAFTAALSVLGLTDVIAPFFVHFIFTKGVSHAFTKALATFFTVCAMPADSVSWAFNDAFLRLFPDVQGGRGLVFTATLLSFLLPVLLAAGFMCSRFLMNNQNRKEAESR